MELRVIDIRATSNCVLRALSQVQTRVTTASGDSPLLTDCYDYKYVMPCLR